MTLRILITGANGFVGRAFCSEALKHGHIVRAALRNPEGFGISGCEVVSVPDIAADTDWTEALRGIEVVIHLAARVHVMREDATDPLEAFRKVNVAGTENLARCAAVAGVKRLVYVSSIGVNGLQTTIGRPFIETDKPNPHNAYTISKWEAEQALHCVMRETRLEVVIVRPPLVYGSGAPGNFMRMLKVLARGIPLPLAYVRNLRSLVYVGNLVDALILCAMHPAAGGQTYLVSDGEDVATPDLLRWLGEAMGRPARLFPCPSGLLRLAGRVAGKSAQVERLTGSLQLDSGKLRRELGWQSPFTLREGLRLAVQSGSAIVLRIKD